VSVNPYRGNRFEATGTYNASSNELKGTVKNITNRDFEGVEVEAKFYNPKGTILSTGKDYFRNFGWEDKYRFRIWFEPGITDYTGRVKLDVTLTDN